MEENKITFEDIEKANKCLIGTDIKGKSYIEVNQRIKAYRMVYPNGMIKPEIKSLKDGVCIFRAEVTNDNGDVIGVGHAYEKENSTFINKTSYIENCETSAVGRALGMAGFGIDTSVASAEEVQNAIENQKEKKEPFSDMPIQEGQKQWLKMNLTEEEIKKAIVNLGHKKLSELNFAEAERLREFKEKQQTIQHKQESEVF